MSTEMIMLYAWIRKFHLFIVLHLPQVNDTAIYYDASVIHIVTVSMQTPMYCIACNFLYVLIYNMWINPLPMHLPIYESIDFLASSMYDG